MNVDAIIAARRAELLATATGRNVACEPRPGGSLTPGELARRRTAALARRHGSTAGRSPRGRSMSTITALGAFGFGCALGGIAAWLAWRQERQS